MELENITALDIEKIFKDKLFYYLKLDAYPKVKVKMEAKTRIRLKDIIINSKEIGEATKDRKSVEWFIHDIFIKYILLVYRRTDLKILRDNIDEFFSSIAYDAKLF